MWYITNTDFIKKICALLFTSHFSTAKDSAILEFELDVEEMAKNHKDVE